MRRIRATIRANSQSSVDTQARKISVRVPGQSKPVEIPIDAHALSEIHCTVPPGVLCAVTLWAQRGGGWHSVAETTFLASSMVRLGAFEGPLGVTALIEV